MKVHSLLKSISCLCAVTLVILSERLTPWGVKGKPCTYSFSGTVSATPQVLFFLSLSISIKNVWNICEDSVDANLICELGTLSFKGHYSLANSRASSYFNIKRLWLFIQFSSNLTVTYLTRRNHTITFACPVPFWRRSLVFNDWAIILISAPSIVLKLSSL